MSEHTHQETSTPSPAVALQAIVNPRPRIRAYLLKILQVALEEAPEAWPQLSSQAFVQQYNALQVKLRQLYQQIDAMDGLHKDDRLSVRLLGESTLSLLKLDWEHPDNLHQASDTIRQLFADRPLATMDFDQLFCTPDSSERRVQKILQEIDATSAKVLFMGDDDLCSLAIAPHFSGELEVIDFDDRLLEFISNQEPKIACNKYDLIYSGLPKAYQGQFDAVVLDPPWEDYFLWCFLGKAIYSLKEDPNARIYLSFCPLNLEHKEGKVARMYQKLADCGLTIESITPTFSLYNLENTEFKAMLLKLVPHIDSPLLSVLQELPYGFSNLYVLRRLPYFRPNPIKNWFFKWVHTK